MNNKAIKIILTFIPIVFFVGSLALNASAASLNIDFITEENRTPEDLVGNLYKFSLGIAGVAALAVMIYGAILYTTSAGNPSKQSDARAWITGAIWGLVLLLAAYLILYTINPDLVDLTSMELDEIK